MAFELVWLPEGDEDMTRLEADPALERVLEAVNRALGRLELDPADRGLRTQQFRTLDLGYIRMSSVGVGDWHILWQSTERPDEFVIRRIVDVAVP
jgi:hypothetical protein